MKLEFEGHDGTFRLLLAHGSPRKINEYLYEDRAESSLQRILDDAQADMLFVGHTHRPYHRQLPIQLQGKTAYRHVVNIGSVGKPKDGDPRACYVILHLPAEPSVFSPADIRVEFRRVAYDVEFSAQALEASNLPHVYADMLRKAY
jgi:diadenosine tetraphosphatase ApaH/serine/threonine PP2A family protein phosphatase